MSGTVASCARASSDRVEQPGLGAKPAGALAVLHGDVVPLLPEEHVLARIAALVRGPQRHATALRCAVDGDITYDALWAQAGGFAMQLAAAGLRRGDLLPVLQSWSTRSVVAYLGALRAGVIPLTLDPLWPPQRIEELLASVPAPAIVCDDDNGDSRAWGLTRITPARTGASEDGLAPEQQLDALAYAFFTSGSTGLPKCTLNYHRGLANRIAYMGRRFGGTAPPTVLLNSRPGFDSSLWQLLLPLCTGGTCVIPRDERRFDAERTIALLRLHQVTMTDVVPTTLALMLQLLRRRPDLARELGALRYLLVGGEELPLQLVSELHALLPGVRVFNTYGPTETAIGVVFHEVRPDQEPVPLGRPIDNVFVAVCDPEGQPCAVRTCGEIVVGGACMGAGYLNNSEATAAVFVPNRVDGTTGATLYRTGDHGYVDDDGLLYFRGRRDHQLKLGGVRGDLGEVEAVLRGVPGVAQAAAGVHGDGTRKFLYAYVVSQQGEAVCRAAAEAALRRLPRAFVPKVIRCIPALPVTTSGKLDRAALHRLHEEASLGGDQADPARGGDALAQLARRAAVLLQRPSVDVDADLFAQGADSLIAAELALEAELLLARPVSMSELYAGKPLRALLTPPERCADGASAALAAADIASLALAPVRVRPAPRAPAQSVLLTGATGFVGSQLLRQLAARAGGPVYCLVRAESDAAAAARVQALLAGAPLRVTGAVLPLRGDLARGDWALPPVDVVLHVAAEVNFAKPYELLRPVNVLGTQQLIERALEAGVQELHYVSSLAVREVCGLPPAAALPEEPLHAQASSAAYPLSKWVGEKLVQQAGEAGLRTAIYRLGEVGPATDAALLPPRSLFFSLLRACAARGVWPFTGALDSTPLDQVCAFIVGCVLDGKRSDAEVFNVVDPVGTAAERIADGLRGHGLHLQATTPGLALQCLAGADLPCEEGELPLPLLCALLRAGEAHADDDWTLRFAAVGETVSTARYRSTAARLGLPLERPLDPAADFLVRALWRYNRHAYH